jgi:hypothetical protein
MRKFFKLNPFTITTFAVVVGIIAFFYGIPFMDIMELKTIDLRFTTRGKIEPGSKIVLARL